MSYRQRLGDGRTITSRVSLPGLAPIPLLSAPLRGEGRQTHPQHSPQPAQLGLDRAAGVGRKREGPTPASETTLPPAKDGAEGHSGLAH